MAMKLQASEAQRVVVLEDEVRIDDFVEADPNVRRVLVDAADLEEVVHTILRIGAQATLIAQTDLDARVVERRFEGMARSFDSSLEGAVSQITELGSKLVDDQDGALPKIFGELKAGIATVLADTFDEDSKSSAIAKIDAVLERAGQRIDRDIRETFDPDAPDSALTRMKRDILETVKEQGRDLRRELKEVAVAVAAGKVRTETVELTAIKGFSFEDLLGVGLASIAAVHGDIAERVGTKAGASGTKHGDHLVTVNPEDTCGAVASFVLECKDRRLSMAKTMDELEKAAANHSAEAAVAVFSRQELAPVPIPFYWSGKRAILVYDKQCPDDDALQLAYAWARWVTRRGLATDAAAVDIGRVEAALTKARQALQRHQTARSCFSAARNKIDEGAGHVSALVDDVRAALSELWDELKRVP
jgi:hypothetical protein